MNLIVFSFFAFILEVIYECLEKIFVAAQIRPRLLYFVDFTVKLHYSLKSSHDEKPGSRDKRKKRRYVNDR